MANDRQQRDQPQRNQPAAQAQQQATPLTAAVVGQLLDERLDKHAEMLTNTILAKFQQTTAPATAAVSADVKPITVHDEDRQQLEQLFGGPMLTFGADIVRHVKQLCGVQLISSNRGMATVDIPLDTLQRLESRVPIDTTLQEYLETEISGLLARLVDGDR